MAHRAHVLAGEPVIQEARDDPEQKAEDHGIPKATSISSMSSMTDERRDYLIPDQNNN